MVQVSRSARLYQDRRQPQFPGTTRGPAPQVYLPDNPVHHLKLEAPLTPPLQPPCELDAPNIDTSNLTEVWPHGDENAL